MKRESGYYWVKSKNSTGWQIAWYGSASKLWFRYGDNNMYYEDSFSEINETRIPEPTNT